MIALILKLGPDQHVRYPLNRMVQRIGRDPNCEIFLEGDLVSRYHAEITHAAGKLVLRDMGSTNGTFVNGRQLTAPVELKQGDEVGIGNQTLVVVDEPDSRLEETSAQDGEAVRHLRMSGAEFPPDEMPPSHDATIAVVRNVVPEQAAAPREATRLVFIGAPAGTEYPLIQPEVRLGRAKSCELVIDQPLVSAQHAKIVLRQGGHFIYDTRSLNGVRVNGHKIRGVRLQNGDEITIGDTRLRYEDPNQPSAPPRTAPPPEVRPGRKWLTWVIIGAGLAVLAAAILLSWR